MRLSILASAVLFLASCTIGNSNATCREGQGCVCNQIGNCKRDCPGGNCNFECFGTGNCIFSCAGGGCQATCQNTGNCKLDCSGGNCDIDCRGGISNCSCESCGPVVDMSRDLTRPDRAVSDGSQIDATTFDSSSGLPDLSISPDLTQHD